MIHESSQDQSDISANVVRALVLYSLAEFQSGHANTIRVTTKGNYFTVEDDGRGHAIGRTVEGSPYLRFIYNHFEYPFGAGQGKPIQLHGIGMSLVNILCSELAVEVRKRDAALRMQFQGGRLIHEETLEAPSDNIGTTVSGRIDVRLGESGVEQQNLRRWLLGVLAASPGLHVHFNGEELSAPSTSDA